MQKKFIGIIGVVMVWSMAFVVSAAQPEKGILYTRPIESVIFSHSDHLQKGTTCATCHSGLFAMEALKAQSSKDFTMDSLYKGKYCGACHNGKKAFASDTQCARCHVGSRYPAPQKETPVYKDSVTLGKGGEGVPFHHGKHLKKANCSSCHPSLFAPEAGAARIRMADHSQNKYCFACHDEQGKGTFSRNDCNRCHVKAMPAPQEAILYGKGAKAVSFKHEKHQIKAGCTACHPKLFAYRKGEVKLDFDDHINRKACFSCHAKKDGSASYSCNVCHKDKPAIKATYYPDTLKYETKMQNIYFHHESHAVFACNLCHPKPFAMKKGKTDMNMTEMMKGKTCGTCHNGTKAFSVRDCARCHKK